MITVLLDPASGRVLFEGRDIADHLVGFRRCLAYVPEEPHLYPFLSGREYLQLVGRLRGLRPKRLDEKADDLRVLHRCRIEERFRTTRSAPGKLGVPVVLDEG